VSEYALSRRAALMVPLTLAVVPPETATGGPRRGEVHRLSVAGHNMTRGRVTRKVARAAIAIGQEIDARRIRNGFPDRYKHWFPPRDPHQSISWDPRRFVVTDRGYVSFHRHGNAEGYPFATPARGLLYVVGHHPGLPDLEVAVAGTWWLNSWNPAGRHDRHTDIRRRIVEETTLPRVKAWLREQHALGRVVIMEGDTNSKPWPGRLPGMRRVKPWGLDRAWISDHPQIRLDGPVMLGPPTGTGDDKRHRSVHLRVELRRRR
jgi:hypothetical protein